MKEFHSLRMTGSDAEAKAASALNEWQKAHPDKRITQWQMSTMASLRIRKGASRTPQMICSVLFVTEDVDSSTG